MRISVCADSVTIDMTRAQAEDLALVAGYDISIPDLLAEDGVAFERIARVERTLDLVQKHAERLGLAR